MDHKVIEWDDMDLINLAQNKHKWQAPDENGNKTPGCVIVRNFLTGWESISISRKVLLHGVI